MAICFTWYLLSGNPWEKFLLLVSEIVVLREFVFFFFNFMHIYEFVFKNNSVLFVPEVSVKLVTSFNKCEGLSDMHFVSCPYY